MGRLKKLKEAIYKGRRLSYFAAVLALVLATLVAWYIIPQPKVGVIRITTPIMGMSTASDIVKMLSYAEESEDIRAVVLEINSPGGSATASEEIYMSVVKLRENKPVVSSIGQVGASGAYYIASGSNLIYAKPTSFVGSIGVMSRLPEREKLDRDTVTTGPFKRTGFSRRDQMYNVKLAQEAFLNAVLTQRGEKIELSREELARATIYIGVEGYENGLVDEIGSTSDAVERAASLAGVSNYKVVEISKLLNITPSIFGSPTYVNRSQLARTNTVPVNYYLYMEMEQ